MKIIYFNYLYDLYGISIGSTIKAIKLMTALKECGHEVDIYWRKEQPGDGKIGSVHARNHLKKFLAKYLHEPNQILKNVKSYFEEQQIIREQSPDLIISRLNAYSCSAPIAAKAAKIPFLLELDCPAAYELHTFNTEFRTNLPVLRYFEKHNLDQAGKIFTVSNTLKEYYVDQGIPDNKMTVITNAADTEKFHPHVDKKRVVDKYDLQNSIVVGFLGSFHYWHGIENLLAVIKKTLALNKKVKFLMVGDGGPMKPNLIRYIKENNLVNQVIMTGYIKHDDIPEYISAMDIVLAPYPHLDFFYYSPVKVYEYMSCGKAVVTTDIGQIAEQIKDGENGFICQPDNIEMMLKKITRLLGDSNLRYRIGQQARETIIKNHTWKKKAQQLSEICYDVALKN